MTSDVQDGRFAPPQAHVDDVDPMEGGLQLATRGSRFLASMIDLVISLCLLWLVSYFTPFNPWGGPDASLWRPQWVGAIAGTILFFAVHGYLLVTRGQTVGKVALKIRIVRPDGTSASAGRLLGLRYGIAWVLGLIPAIGQIWGRVDCLLIFRASRRCLHDTIADTIVVRA